MYYFLIPVNVSQRDI